LNYLRQWRKGKGLTQEQFAEIISEPRGTYQAYESGRSSIPADVQEKIKKEGFVGVFPEVGTEVSKEDLQTLGQDLARKIDYAHEDLKRENQVLGAAVAAILAELQALKGSRKG
jgi:transcriptional regulator with XRE-family HTH domain